MSKKYERKNKKVYHQWVLDHKDEILALPNKQRTDYVVSKLKDELNLEMQRYNVYQLLYRNGLINHKNVTSTPAIASAQAPANAGAFANVEAPVEEPATVETNEEEEPSESTYTVYEYDNKNHIYIGKTYEVGHPDVVVKTEEVDNPMSEYEQSSEADAPVVYSNNSFRDALCNFLGPKALEKITFVEQSSEANSDSEEW